MNPIIVVVGARPNFMKMAPLYQDLKRRKLPVLFLHTGQHYDKNMSKVFFDELEMPEPDIYLGVGSGSHAEQTAKIMIDFEKVCVKEKPSMVIVAFFWLPIAPGTFLKSTPRARRACQK